MKMNSGYFVSSPWQCGDKTFRIHLSRFTYSDLYCFAFVVLVVKFG